MMPNRIRNLLKERATLTLIADTDKKLVEQFGVWGEKSMYGRKYMGTSVQLSSLTKKA